MSLKEMSAIINIPPGSRFLLCRPRGGLNDMLCQIEKCCRYSKLYNRILFVDGQQTAFATDISHYFQMLCPENRVFFRFSHDWSRLFNSMSCKPSVVQSKLESYRTRLIQGGNFCEYDSKTRLTFDFNKDHKEQLLVHHQCGGGTLANLFVKRICLSSHLKDVVRRNQKRIISKYNQYGAIHIRNTDLKTNYRDMVEFVCKKEPGCKILVCTDSKNVVDDLQSSLGDKVFFSSDIFDVKEQPLHNLATFNQQVDRINQMEMAIADLVALSSSNKFYFTDTSNGSPSGFSLLAEYFCNNKQVLLRFTGVEPELLGMRTNDGKQNATYYLSNYANRIKLSLKKSYLSLRGEY